jgi:hypothetical protein
VLSRAGLRFCHSVPSNVAGLAEISFGAEFARYNSNMKRHEMKSALQLGKEVARQSDALRALIPVADSPAGTSAAAAADS